MKTFNLKGAVVALGLALAVSLPAFAGPYGEYRVDGRKNIVLYEGTPVRGADVHTFRDLGFGYGKDRKHVYFYGRILEFVDPSTFRVSKSFGCGSDSDRFEGPVHDNCHNPDYNPHSSSGYHVTAFDAYYGGKVIKGAFVGTFKVLSNGYAKDAFNVYWCGKEVDGADPSTFKVLKGGYAKDAFNTFYNGKEVD